MDYAFDLFSIINLFLIKTIIKNLELNQYEYELNPSLYVPSTCTLSEFKIVHENGDSMQSSEYMIQIAQSVVLT